MKLNFVTLWLAVAAVVLMFSLIGIEMQLKRCADALNESNHIMVGVENGDVPGAPQRFNQASPAKTF